MKELPGIRVPYKKDILLTILVNVLLSLAVSVCGCSGNIDFKSPPIYKINDVDSFDVREVNEFILRLAEETNLASINFSMNTSMTFDAVHLYEDIQTMDSELRNARFLLSLNLSFDQEEELWVWLSETQSNREYIFKAYSKLPLSVFSLENLTDELLNKKLQELNCADINFSDRIQNANAFIIAKTDITGDLLVDFELLPWRHAEFKTENGSKNVVQFMKSRHLPYYSLKNYSCITADFYDGRKLAYLLPNEGISIQKIMEELEIDELVSEISNEPEETKALVIPPFELSTNCLIKQESNDILTMMICHIDFNNLAHSKQLMIDEAIGPYTLGIADPLYFDRPFLMIIFDPEVQVILDLIVIRNLDCSMQPESLFSSYESEDCYS